MADAFQVDAFQDGVIQVSLTPTGLIATADDFEGTGPEPIYADYTRLETEQNVFQRRADWIVATYPSATTICIAGVGYGFLMRKLIDKGKTVAGIDASNFARGKASTLTPAEMQLFIVDDCSRDSAYRQAAQASGLGNTGRFNLVVTEDLLPCASDDAEAVLFINAARGRATENIGQVLHIVTASKSGDVLGNLANPPADLGSRTLRTARLLWHTLEAWKTLAGNPPVGITETWLDTETWRVI